MTAPGLPLILQFGTSRFLQAHVDYFVDQSLEAGHSTARIVVVQTSANPAGKKRVEAFNRLPSYPLHTQGIEAGQTVDRVEQVASIACAMQADESWGRVVELFCTNVTHVISNTSDSGYQLSPHDQVTDLPPSSFPAKLVVLLLARYRRNGKGVTIMPCELIADNGRVLQKTVFDLARQWQLDAHFLAWLEADCLWVNSLVDRIVSSALDPIGAVTEPYALWAIEDQPGLVVPCTHPAIRLVADLAPLERLKLSVLNLAHTYLVEHWLQLGSTNIQTVFHAMNDATLRPELEAVLAEEVVPILKSMQMGEDIDAYVDTVRDRFLNPFLDHQLTDIAQNHIEKLERRVLPVWQARSGHDSPRLYDCLSRHQLVTENNK